MTVEFKCGQCKDLVIGTTPELGEAKRPAALGATIIINHFTKTGHDKIFAKGDKTIVELISSPLIRPAIIRYSLKKTPPVARI